MIDDDPIAWEPAPDDRPVTPFGTWLLEQIRSPKWYADLAKAAKGDPSFPKRGDAAAVNAHLIARGIGEGDVYEQLDDAARDWAVACRA